MADQQQIVGGEALGNPNATQAPVAPPPSPGPAAAMPAAQQAPQTSFKQDDVDQFISQMEGKFTPEKEPQAEDGSHVDDFIKQMEGDFGVSEEPPPNPNEGLLSKVKSRFGAEVQQLKAELKTGLARNDTETRTALEQVYGKDNIRFSGDTLYVRPQGSKKFRKFDSDMFTQAIDVGLRLFSSGRIDTAPAVNAVGKAMGYNPNLPTTSPGMGLQDMAKIPGLAAQGITTAAGTVAGAAVGNVPGAAAGGFAGGFLGNKARKEVNQKLSEYLGQADPDFHYENKISSLADALDNDYVQGAIGAVAGGFAQHNAVASANKAALIAKGLTEPEIEAVNAVDKVPEQSNFAKFTSALKEYKDHFFPSTNESPAPGEALGVAKKEMEHLGTMISAIKNEVASLEEQKQAYTQPDEFLKAVQTELKKHGVNFTEDGWVDDARTELRATAPANARVLMELNDEAATNRNIGKGIPIDRVETIMKKLDDLAGYEKASRVGSGSGPSEAEITAMRARQGLAADRIAHVSRIYGGEDSIDAQTFRHYMTEYNQKKESWDTVRGILDTPAKLNLFAKKVTGQGSEKAFDVLDSFRHILGDDSPQWKNLKAEVLSSFIDDATPGRGTPAAKVNAKALTGFLNNRDNQPVLDLVFGGDKKSLGILKTLAAQGENIQTATEPSNLNKALIDLYGQISHRLPALRGVKLLSSLTGNNKVSIDYAGDALLNAMNKAVGSEQRGAMLEQLQAIDTLKAKSQIVDVPVHVNGKTVLIKRYVPMMRMPGPRPQETPQ